MVTMVIPSFNRRAALEDCLPTMLAVRGVDEVLLIDDGSQDDTVAWASQVADPRLRVIALGERHGLTAVRNRGLDEARGDWVVMGEDDCKFPPDYVEVLLAAAAEHDARVVGCPWLFPEDGVAIEDAVAAARADAVDAPGLDELGRFPRTTVRTPFLSARAMVHRDVFSRLRYDEGLVGNAWREETDYFLRAERAGFTVVLTPGTYSWQERFYPGGAHTAKWRYTLWSVRNNGRFLRRHGRWLHERGVLGDPVRTELAFVADRAWYLAQFYGRPIAGNALRRAGLKD